MPAGLGLLDPGSLQRLQVVVDDIEAAHADLSGRGVEVSDVQDFPSGRFVFFSDPDGNRLGRAADRPAGLARIGRR